MDHTTTPLRDFATSDPNAIPPSIVRPPITANNFQFNPAFITLFQQDQFGGYLMENCWRSVTRSRWTGSPMMPSGWGYFLSLWRIRPSLGFWTQMQIRSLLGMVSLRHSYASIFLPGRPPNTGTISPPSLKWRVSFFMRDGSNSKWSNGSDHTMASQIGCWRKRSTMVFNNRWRSHLMWPLEVLLWPNPSMKPGNYLKI